jgi:hypothetical protein
MSNIIHDDTIVSGIVCTRCNNELPPMTVKEHLDGKFNKECPHLPVKRIGSIDTTSASFRRYIQSLTPEERAEIFKPK